MDGEEQKLNPGQNTGSAVHRLSRDVMTVAFIGIATYEPGKDTCTEDVRKRADAAMYQDKVAMKAERRD